MPEAPRSLSVWCFGRLAGELFDTSPRMTFVYEPQWVSDGRPPLSQSLPIDGVFGADASAAFFGGLLPEGAPRGQLARRLGVSQGNDFSLLSAVAGDTAGAISLQPHGEPPRASDQHDVEWLDEAQLIEVLKSLPSRPMHADEDGEYRLSLAGAQDKLPVVIGAGGRVGLTRGQTPSTHILKTPIERLDGTVLNEALCPAFGRKLGLDVVSATPRHAQGNEYLLIERYDRRRIGDDVERLHQEDFCQALGVPTERKYQSEGGPSLADCFGLVRRAAEVPALEVLKLVDSVALSFLVGNHDAHGKNFALLYLPERSGAVLTPAYDILSSVAYQQSHNLTRNMAMKIGGQYKPEYLEPRHLDRLIEEAGLGAAAVRRRLSAYARDAPNAVRAARAELAADGWDAPVLERVVGVVDQRASRLASLAAPGRHRRSSQVDGVVDSSAAAPAPLERAGHVAPGQHWKDFTDASAPPRTITVSGVSGEGVVHGFVESADGPPNPAQWSREEFGSFVLTQDPHWPTYIVAAKIAHEDPLAIRVSRMGGELEGVRSHTVAAGALAGPESSWRVIAPTEADALGLVQHLIGPDVPIRAALRWRDEP